MKIFKTNSKDIVMIIFIHQSPQMVAEQQIKITTKSLSNVTDILASGTLTN